MRRILVDNAHRKLRAKHGGEWKRVNFDSMAEICVSTDEELLALDDALAKLAAEDDESAQIVKLKYFAGLTIPRSRSSWELHPAPWTVVGPMLDRGCIKN